MLLFTDLRDLGESRDGVGVIFIREMEGVVVEAVDDETDDEGEESEG